MTEDLFPGNYVYLRSEDMTSAQITIFAPPKHAHASVTEITCQKTQGKLNQENCNLRRQHRSQPVFCSQGSCISRSLRYNGGNSAYGDQKEEVVSRCSLYHCIEEEEQLSII